MHVHDPGPVTHSHVYADPGMHRRSAALVQVTVLTLAAMVVELVAGWWSGSLALTADGWHMGTHALALGAAVLAYRLSARASRHAGFAFGGWKIEVLIAYTSGLALLAAAAWLVVEAVSSLRAPREIAYGEAMGVAVIGLAVNLVSAWLLSRGARAGEAHAHAHAHGHGHAHSHAHGHGHAHAHSHAEVPAHARGQEPDQGPARDRDAAGVVGHGEARGEARARRSGGHDHNFAAAYMHVIADALTSVLAIVALAGGLWWSLAWLDPVVALLGAAVIGRWSVGVIAASARGLIDATADPRIVRRIHEVIESDGDAKVADLHVWQVGTSTWWAAVSIVADRPLTTQAYRSRLEAIEQLQHVTVEIHACIRPV